MDKKFIDIKICKKCNESKTLDMYHKDSTKRDGLRNSCKECQKSYSSGFYKENRDRINDYSNNYYKKVSNKEEYKTKRKEYMDTWIMNNLDRKKAYDKEYNIKNRELIKEQKLKNKEHINRVRRNTRRNNPLIRTKNNIRTLIFISIKNGGFSKSMNTQKILGCSFVDFKIHLESKFEHWMNWDNYGKYNGDLEFGWDIDHIIPVSSANSIDDIYLLNHYSNLQPLCSKINRDIKRDKL